LQSENRSLVMKFNGVSFRHIQNQRVATNK
jgi:hypothetical protein